MSTDRFLDADLKKKIALFCDVDPEAVITAKDVSTIYEVPLVLGAEGLDKIVLKHLGLPMTEKHMESWEALVERIKNPKDKVTIHVVGKYVGYEDSYKSLNEALYHGGFNHRLRSTSKGSNGGARAAGWYHSCSREGRPFWSPGGLETRGTRGMMKAAQIERERDIPYFGICYELSMGRGRYARGVCGSRRGLHRMLARNRAKAHLQIRDLLGVDDLGGTMRLDSTNASWPLDLWPRKSTARPQSPSVTVIAMIQLSV